MDKVAYRNQLLEFALSNPARFNTARSVDVWLVIAEVFFVEDAAFSSGNRDAKQAAGSLLNNFPKALARCLVQQVSLCDKKRGAKLARFDLDGMLTYWQFVNFLEIAFFALLTSGVGFRVFLLRSSYQTFFRKNRKKK